MFLLFQNTRHVVDLHHPPTLSVFYEEIVNQWTSNKHLARYFNINLYESNKPEQSLSSTIKLITRLLAECFACKFLNIRATYIHMSRAL